MWPHSFWRVVVIIVLIIVGLLLIIVALRFYGQYVRTPTDTTTTTATTVVNNTSTSIANSNTSNPYLPTADDDPAIGASDPTVDIISFEDFQCPFCQESAPIMRQLVQKYPNDVRYVFRDFPLYTIHPQATIAAQAAECADEQNQFWAWHDLVYARQNQLADADTVFPQWAQELGLDVNQFSTCYASAKYKAEVEKDLNSGILAGVTGTPTFFVNGNKIEGVLTLEQWEQIVDQLLAKS